MQIGITATDVDRVIEEARTAERLGFDLVGCGEHLFFGAPTPNPFVELAAAAAVTSRVRLVSTVALLPLYPAALVAKMSASLDRVSGGRFELGVGAGGEFPPEFAAAGVDPASRFRRLDEGLRLIRSLFDGGPTTFAGEFASVDGLELDPPPVQPGGPPIWLGGRKSGAMRRAGRYADVWMPYMVDTGALRRTLTEVREHAVAAGRPDTSVTGALFVWACVDEDGDRARRVGTATVSKGYRQDFTGLAERYLALGTPQEVAARLVEFAGAGATRVLVQPACPPEERRAMVEALAGAVLPLVRSAVR
ncbi:LLM class flavin-dependent oxidoreductase [Pseudonocardia sp. GCM10023141]|uniref:LLM class flavin-dependent oxidoreductase n=1 Tax=Pseudonocardia sp. GCM10023141 TaxID=3252653 RepID=UPI003613961E